MTKNKYIVELEDGVFIATTNGDPGRTLVKDSAQVFISKLAAEKKLQKARTYRPFLYAKIHNLINKE